jgi:hypothetical protein
VGFHQVSPSSLAKKNLAVLSDLVLGGKKWLLGVA